MLARQKAEDRAYYERKMEEERLRHAEELAAMVYALDGTKLAEIQTYLPEAGSCTLDVMRKDPVIVRIQTKNGVQVFKLMAAE